MKPYLLSLCMRINLIMFSPSLDCFIQLPVRTSEITSQKMIKTFMSKPGACLPVLQRLASLGRQCMCICKITHVKLLCTDNTNFK